MRPELVILTHVVTEPVNCGFLPAAQELGLKVTILTDQPEEHHRHFSRPDLPAYPDEILGCDVFNPIAVMELLEQRGRPAALFSNSDHLQTVTALAADYFGLQGKDWRICYRAKNKAATRVWSQARGVEAPWFRELTDADGLDAALSHVPYPAVAKPKEGVASKDVGLVSNAGELRAFTMEFWQRYPGQALLIEGFLEGPLMTLETLGDGEHFEVLGGFRVELSPPPHFVELRAHWIPVSEEPLFAEMAEQVRAFGVQFGACHSEFVLTAQGPRLIEINYRSVGDGRELLLDRMLDFPLFTTILRLHLGEPLANVPECRQHALIEYLVAEHEGKVTASPQAFQESFAQGELSFQPLRCQGDQIAITHSNKDYLGVIKAFGADRSVLRHRVAEQAETLASQWEIAP